jgi:hypothetical protein
MALVTYRPGASLALVALSTFVACQRKPTEDLPSERPADFAISYRTTSAMAGGGSRELRCDTRCTETIGYDFPNDFPPTTYPVTPAQLDALYRVVREHRVDRLRSVPVPRRSVGFDSRLTVRANGKSFVVSTDAVDALPPEQQADYEAVRAALLALRDRLAGDGG